MPLLPKTKVSEQAKLFLHSDSCSIYNIFFPPGTQTFDLMKSTDYGATWKVIHKDVFSFGTEGKFLYTSAQIPGVCFYGSHVLLKHGCKGICHYHAKSMLSS